MPEAYDFERAWQERLAGCVEEVAGAEVRQEVMAGAEGLSMASRREEVIAWSRLAMERLEALVEEKDRRAIMLGCACQYPKTSLQEVREYFQATGDLDGAHAMLQAQFESFLRETLRLADGHFEEVVSRGWGAAGVREGEQIIATKIPKSGFLVEYLQETDGEKRRQLYCHCPRVRDALKMGEMLSRTYCYCGAGFYKGIWEEILGQPVEVELQESVLDGDEVCKVAIHLPPGA
jgi:hypothetical protein